MHKILILLSLTSLAIGASTDHLTDLRKKYPYGLLTNDYGILTVNDLALNACRIRPAPFVPGENQPYQYWLCFRSKSVRAVCEDANASNEDGHVGWVRVRANDNQFEYNFIKPRPWPIRDCREFVRDLKRLLTGTSHACISASYIDKEKKNETGRLERMGYLNRLKTRKGCEGEECRLTKWIKSEFCPDPKSS